jgi:hypothetical protein
LAVTYPSSLIILSYVVPDTRIVAIIAVMILWRIDLLLTDDSVNSDRFWATAGKYVPVARRQFLNNAIV